MRFALALLALAACGKGDSDSDATPDTDDTDVAPATCADSTTTGMLEIAFHMEGDLIPSMDNPPVGPFYGSIFAGEDVTSLGPVDGAVAIQDITVDPVDLQPDGGPSGVLFTSGALPACRVVVLGCLDVDGNDCDQGDPVTLPNQNGVVVVADTTTPVTVQMNILDPG